MASTTFKRSAAAGIAGTALAFGGVLATAGVASASPHTAPAAVAHPANAAATASADVNHVYYGKVVGAPHGLVIRSAPNTGSRNLGSLPNGTRVAIECKVNGQSVKGNHIWYKMAPRTGPHGWLSARYVLNESPIPYC